MNYCSELEDPHVNFNWGGYDASSSKRMRSSLLEAIKEVGEDKVKSIDPQIHDLLDFFKSFSDDICRYCLGEVDDCYMEGRYDCEDFICDRFEDGRYILRECGGLSD